MRHIQYCAVILIFLVTIIQYKWVILGTFTVVVDCKAPRYKTLTYILNASTETARYA